MVTFESAQGTTTIRLDEEAIRPRVRSFVDKVNARTAGLRMDADSALKAVRDLSEAAYLTLARSAHHSFPQVAQRWETVTSWLRSVPGTRGGELPPRVVEIVATDSSDYLPWEWMGPRTGLPSSADDESSLMAAAGELIGMAMCRRIYDSEAQTSPLRQIEASMQVRGFFNQSLPTAPEEIRYFARKGFRLIGPLPDQSLGFGGELGDHLFDPSFPVAGDVSAGRDDVVHFCCHHGTRPGVSRGFDDIPPSLLEFDDATTVDSETLHDQLASRWYGPDPDRLHRPLVFLNLCDGELHPGTLASLTRLFIRNENPTVVGSAAIVRDRVASAFMRRFYDHYRNAETAAESLWHAKYALLKEHRNPFGLVYTLCGNPSLRVVDTRPALGNPFLGAHPDREEGNDGSYGQRP